MTHEGLQSASDANEAWLPIVEYSLKSGLSLSTIRRKIKTNSIPFRLEKGKYFILHSEKSNTSTINAPGTEPQWRQKLPQTQSVELPHAYYSTPATTSPPTTYPSHTMPSLFIPPGHRPEVDPNQIPLIERAVRMVSDAFENTLKEKDERIRLLEERNRDIEERMAELQLLVKVLEEKYSIEY